MLKKIIIQFIIAAIFCTATIFATNYVIMQENFELLKFNLYNTNEGILTMVNDNKKLYIDALISILFFILYSLTALKSIAYRDVVKKPWQKQKRHFAQMISTAVVFTILQFVYLNIKEFNNGSFISIHSFIIPAIILVCTFILTIIFVYGRLGVDYILPVNRVKESKKSKEKKAE